MINKKHKSALITSFAIISACILCLVALNQNEKIVSFKSSRILQSPQLKYTTAVPAIQSLQNQTWVQLFRDDFNGTNLNSSVWTPLNNFMLNELEQAYYQQQNVYVQGGNLVIQTKYQQNVTTYNSKQINYTTGWVQSQNKFSYKYGYAEARMKFSSFKNNDTIYPAFWSKGNGQQWPVGGEIDTAMIVSTWGSNGQPVLFGGVNYGPQLNEPLCSNCVFAYNGQIDFTQYHVYTTVWNETQIDWYIDGVLYSSVKNGTTINGALGPVSIPQTSQFLIFNQAMWANYAANQTDYPKYMYVDYVRVLQPLQTYLKQQIQLVKPTVPSLQNQQWVQLFRDDFNGNSVDQSAWTVYDYFYHAELEGNFYRANNVKVQNGNLVISTTYTPNVTQANGKSINYTSGWLETQNKFTFKYGYAEARIKFTKMVQNDAIWPAFWSLGNNMEWPVGGEIDTLEINANWGSNGVCSLYGTNHWGFKRDQDQCYACATRYPKQIDFTQYHTYTSVWNETQIDWYFDGNLYRTIKNGTTIDGANGPVFIPQHNHYLILNQAVWILQQANPSDYPKNMEVDYVAVLQPLNTYLSQNNL